MLFIGLGGLYSLRSRPLFKKYDRYDISIFGQRWVAMSTVWRLDSFKRDGYMIGFATLVYKNAFLFLILISYWK